MGMPATRPIIEMTIPSSLDRTISPPGAPSPLPPYPPTPLSPSLDCPSSCARLKRLSNACMSRGSSRLGPALIGHALTMGRSVLWAPRPLCFDISQQCVLPCGSSLLLTGALPRVS